MESPTIYRLLATFFVAISFCIWMAFVESKALHYFQTFLWHEMDPEAEKYYDAGRELAHKSLDIFRGAPMILTAIFLLNYKIFPPHCGDGLVGSIAPSNPVLSSQKSFSHRSFCPC